jgi:type IV pilus assembly protein PilA
MKNKVAQGGITLLKLLLIMAILGVLIAIAVPSYQNYAKHAYFSKFIQATDAFRVAAGECIQARNRFVGCNAGVYGIPPAIATGALGSIAVVDGVITATPVPAYGITEEDTYILTPSIDGSDILTWEESGMGVDKGYDNR